MREDHNQQLTKSIRIAGQFEHSGGLRGHKTTLRRHDLGPPVAATPLESVHDRQAPPGSSLLRADALRACALRLLVDQVGGCFTGGRFFAVGG